MPTGKFQRAWFGWGEFQYFQLVDQHACEISFQTYFLLLQMFYHLTAPLIHMQAEFAAREKRLLELISTKDIAIAEYKITGAIILPTINTDPFNTEQLHNINPAYNSLNAVLEHAGSMYCKALKR